MSSRVASSVGVSSSLRSDLELDALKQVPWARQPSRLGIIFAASVEANAGVFFSSEYSF